MCFHRFSWRMLLQRQPILFQILQDNVQIPLVKPLKQRSLLRRYSTQRILTCIIHHWWWVSLTFFFLTFQNSPQMREQENPPQILCSRLALQRHPAWLCSSPPYLSHKHLPLTVRQERKECIFSVCNDTLACFPLPYRLMWLTSTPECCVPHWAAVLTSTISLSSNFSLWLQVSSDEHVCATGFNSSWLRKHMHSNTETQWLPIIFIQGFWHGYY